MVITELSLWSMPMLLFPFICFTITVMEFMRINYMTLNKSDRKQFWKEWFIFNLYAFVTLVILSGILFLVTK